MCGIYLITNTLTNKVYVGQSVDIKRRWSEHRARALDPNNNCYEKLLYRSIRKHGIEVFKFSVLCECTQEELNVQEKYYIQKYNCVVPNGYNVLNENNAPYYTKEHSCSCCGKSMHYDTVHNLCRDCYVKSTRKVERPAKEELITILYAYKGNFRQVGKLFGLTDSAIRKWCKSYDLPFHSKDYR